MDKKIIPNGKISMTASDDGELITLHIDGYIGWWHDKHEMRYYLEGKTPSKILLNITSEGGDPLQATAMFNYLKQYAKEKDCAIETVFTGFAASSATYLGLVGETRKVMSNCLLLFHEPSTYVGGTADEIQRGLDNLNAIKEVVINQHVVISSKTKEEITALLKADRWMTAEEALEYGFVTEIVQAVEGTDVDAEMKNKAQVFKMLGYPKYKTPKKVMETKENKTEEGIVGMVKSIFKSKEEKKPKDSNATEMAILETAKEVSNLKDLVAEMQKGTSHKPSATPEGGNGAGSPTMTAPFLNRNREMFMLGVAQREKQKLSENALPYGFVSLSKNENEAYLNTLERLAMYANQGGVYNMSVINDPALDNAWDFSEIIAELGGAQSVEVLNQIFAEYQRYDTLESLFTIETGIKHIRRSIDGEAASVVRPFHSSGDAKHDIFDWSLTKQEVHACMAVIEKDAFVFARTYFAKLQTAGFTPYNYPAALHLMELFADRILKDLSVVIIKGVRNDAGTGLLDSLDGFRKKAIDIRTALTNGVAPVITGSIFSATPTPTFYHDKAMQMVNIFDEHYRDDARYLYCAPAFARALYGEYVARHIYTQTVKDTQEGPVKRFLIDRTNTMVVPVKELAGSELLVCTPKTNAIVSMDASGDLGKAHVEAKLFTQKVGVAFQAGFDFKRIKPQLLAINDQN